MEKLNREDVIFRAAWERRLNALEIRDAFVTNCLNSEFGIDLAALNACKSWSAFVSMAFVGADTPEGEEYWAGVRDYGKKEESEYII